MSKRPTSVCSLGSSNVAGSPQRRISSASSSVSPSGAASSGGFGISASASSRSASTEASSCSACWSSSLTPRSASSCSGVGLPFSFVLLRSSSTRGTTARHRSSAASHASNCSAAPLRASLRRNPPGSLRAARWSITTGSLRRPRAGARCLPRAPTGRRGRRGRGCRRARSQPRRRSRPNRAARGRSRRRPPPLSPPP